MQVARHGAGRRLAERRPDVGLGAVLGAPPLELCGEAAARAGGRELGRSREGALLPFGGYKGGNVALLVELLATLAGGRFSSDAAPFDRGAESPSIGVVVVAVSTDLLDPGYGARLAAQLERWHSEHGAQPDVWTTFREATSCSVPRDLHDRLAALAAAAG